MELHLKNWYKKFLEELPKTKELKIISPFVSEQVIRKIHKDIDFQKFELITRFNLQDFAMKISSLKSLKFAVENGAGVFGIRGLHSKVYLFDKRAAIITSANLTLGGLENNFECGICLSDNDIILNLHKYFNELKAIAKSKLTVDLCDEWESQLAGIKIPKGKEITLPDFGASLKQIDKTRSYYVKFFGTSDNRVDMNFRVKDEINQAYCHYACGFPKNKRPRQVNDGDIIFMARMTRDPIDYAIFGKAVAIKYLEGRDKASKIETKLLPWKKNWPIYLRVYDPVFIEGTMLNCVLLSDLIKTFDYNSFSSTKKRFNKGELDIKPKKSLMQKPYIKLTKDSAEWLSEKFDEALTTFEKYSKLQPGSTEGLTYIAKVKYGQKKYDEALTILDDVVTKNPGEDLSSAYKYLAYVYNEKEEYDKALEYFLKVPKNIFDTEDYIKLAQIYYNKKDMDNAYKYFDEALIADSTDNTVFYQLGIMQFNDKKYDNAITSFDRSIRLGTKQLAAYVYKGLSFYSLQKYEDALNSFDYANSIDNSYVPSWLWKARAEVALNKLDEARLSYNKVLELDPQNQSAKEDLAILDKK